ncbi:hypothetical protein ACQRIT_001262 [Beauveria bassiana]
MRRMPTRAYAQPWRLSSSLISPSIIETVQILAQYSVRPRSTCTHGARISESHPSFNDGSNYRATGLTFPDRSSARTVTNVS